MQQNKLQGNLSQSKLIQASLSTRGFKHSNLLHRHILSVSEGTIWQHSKSVYAGLIAMCM